MYIYIYKCICLYVCTYSYEHIEVPISFRGCMATRSGSYPRDNNLPLYTYEYIYIFIDICMTLSVICIHLCDVKYHIYAFMCHIYIHLHVINIHLRVTYIHVYGAKCYTYTLTWQEVSRGKMIRDLLAWYVKLMNKHIRTFMWHKVVINTHFYDTKCRPATMYIYIYICVCIHMYKYIYTYK